MADRNTDNVLSIGKNRVLVPFSFAPDTAANPAAGTQKGQGVTSVVHTGTGLFTLTLDDTWGQLDSFTTTLQLATAADQFAQGGTYVAASKTLVIAVWDISGNAVADVAKNANNRINVNLVFRNSASEN